MRSHQSLFNRELQLEESKFMEMQFERRENDAEMSKEAMHQIQAQMEDLRSSNKRTEDQLSAAFEKLNGNLETLSRRTEASRGEREGEARFLKSRVSQIKKWINGPEYMTTLERSRAKRTPSTCEWYLSSQQYRAWKSYKFLTTEARPESSVMAAPGPKRFNPILLTSAKPGFGKTTLSSLIIDDLGLQPITDGLSHESECVLFYHFVSEQPELCLASNAWRAILSQLIHGCRQQRDVIDALSVLYEESSMGQRTASEEEVMQCLLLLLPRFSGIVLLFDGIDECNNSYSFLESMGSLCTETCTKSLLLGRPNIELPKDLRDLSYFDINHFHNYDDIVLYLTPEIQCLQAKSWIRADPPLKEVVSVLANKSAGMFLWAYLMTRYLSCRALSPKERHEAIFVSSLVEGMEGLYSAILDTISNSYSIQHAKVQKIFYLIAIAARPLSTSELQFALAIKPGKVTDTDDLIPDFKESLPVICGSLVEVSDRGIISFIHSSLHDFLTARDAGCHQKFLVDACHRHLDVASLCLSYLVYDTSRSPLNWPTRSPGSLSALQAIFPFLRYSLNWVYHASEGLRLLEKTVQPLEEAISKLVSLVSKFMRARMSVTFWVESSWTLGKAPVLDCLAKQLATADGQSLYRALESHAGFLRSFQQLSSDISRLKDEWGHLLTQQPSAIWTSSITAFVQSDFLFQTSDFTISSLAPLADDHVSSHGKDSAASRSIFIESQVSDSGKVLGMVVVTPSSTYTDVVRRVLSTDPTKASLHLSETQKRDFIKAASSGWKVRYDQRSTQTEATILSYEFELPGDDVCQLLSQSMASDNPERFPFPIAMNADLTRLIVLRTLVTIHPAPKTQRLDSPNKKPRGMDSSDVAYSPAFSPNGNSIAFVTGKQDAGQIQMREIEVWSAEQVSGAITTAEPVFLRKGSVIASWLSVPQIRQHDTSLGFAFHPTLPFIAFSEWIYISGWFFCHHGPEQRSWKNDGASQPFTVDISKFLKAVLLDLLSTSPSNTQSVSVLVENQGASTAGLSLHRDQVTSAVILWDRTCSGETNEVVLAHLPQSARREQTFVSLLNFRSTDEWVRMVWNKGAQKSYSVHDEANPYLPSIISRKRVLASEVDIAKRLKSG
ncbi:hypothetical protein OQA88_5122 [Cercophora sp. LCS_1]